jgi:hypothetical protein
VLLEDDEPVELEEELLDEEPLELLLLLLEPDDELSLDDAELLDEDPVPLPPLDDELVPFGSVGLPPPQAVRLAAPRSAAPPDNKMRKSRRSLRR